MLQVMRKPAVALLLPIMVSACNTVDVIIGSQADKVCDSLYEEQFSSNYELAIASIAKVAMVDKKKAQALLDKTFAMLGNPYVVSYDTFVGSVFYIAGLDSSTLKKGFNLSRADVDSISNSEKINDVNNIAILQRAGYRLFYDGKELTTAKQSQPYIDVNDINKKVSIELTKAVPVLTTFEIQLKDSLGISRKIEIQFLLHNPEKPTKDNIFNVKADTRYNDGYTSENLANILTIGQPYGGCSIQRSVAGDNTLPFPLLRGRVYKIQLDSKP